MVTVIIVVYNAEKYLKYAIDSVLKQTYKDYEIIAVDDGSTDSTLGILTGYSDLSNFTIIKMNHNQNLGGNRNEAIKIAKGEYIAFIDGDDIWEEDKLEIQLDYIKNIDMVCSNSTLINEKNEIISDKYSYDFDSDVDLSLAQLLYNNWVTVSSVLMKKSAIEKAGYFEDGPDTRAEDYVLWLSYLSTRSNKIKYINKPLLKYRIHNNNWSNSTSINWVRLLKRTIDIRSVYIKDNDNDVRKAAKKGCISCYLSLAKLSYNNKEFDKAKSCIKNILDLFEEKISFKYFKYRAVYLYLSILNLIN